MEALRLPKGPPGMIGMATTEYAYKEEVLKRRINPESESADQFPAI
jgi:hypothetical protein